jgi:hypothetical protein
VCCQTLNISWLSLATETGVQLNQACLRTMCSKKLI